MLDMFREYFLPCTINIITVVYVMSKIIGKRLEFNKFQTYIKIFALICVSIINYMFVKDFIRMIIILPVLCFFNYLIFKEKLNVTIVSVIVEQMILFISEILFIGGTIIFLKADGNVITNTYYGQLFANVGISIIAVLLVNLNIVSKIYKRLLVIGEKLSTKFIVYAVTIIVVTINILLASVYRETNILQILILNLLFIIVYSVIIYRTLVEKSNSVQIQASNKALVDTLNEYENLLDYQRVANHENKNQLLVIKTMLSEGDKKISEYIDEIVKEQREDNEALYTEAKRIPSGGLQGIIYQKMLKMNEKDIKADLNISRNIRKLEISKMDTKLNYDLCRILGVFLDNAIEETEQLESKEKEIGISMYEDEGVLCIEVSNCFCQAPDLEKMDDKGYTTKGTGHGYGLPLVKEIIEKNQKIVNERTVFQDVFTQILKVTI